MRTARLPNKAIELIASSTVEEQEAELSANFEADPTRFAQKFIYDYHINAVNNAIAKGDNSSNIEHLEMINRLVNETVIESRNIQKGGAANTSQEKIIQRLLNCDIDPYYDANFGKRHLDNRIKSLGIVDISGPPGKANTPAKDVLAEKLKKLKPGSTPTEFTTLFDVYMNKIKGELILILQIIINDWNTNFGKTHFKNSPTASNASNVNSFYSPYRIAAITLNTTAIPLNQKKNPKWLDLQNEKTNMDSSKSAAGNSQSSPWEAAAEIYHRKTRRQNKNKNTITKFTTNVPSLQSKAGLKSNYDYLKNLFVNEDNYSAWSIYVTSYVNRKQLELYKYFDNEFESLKSDLKKNPQKEEIENCKKFLKRTICKIILQSEELRSECIAEFKGCIVKILSQNSAGFALTGIASAAAGAAAGATASWLGANAATTRKVGIATGVAAAGVLHIKEISEVWKNVSSKGAPGYGLPENGTGYLGKMRFADWEILTSLRKSDNDNLSLLKTFNLLFSILIQHPVIRMRFDFGGLSNIVENIIKRAIYYINNDTKYPQHGGSPLPNAPNAAPPAPLAPPAPPAPPTAPAKDPEWMEELTFYPKDFVKKWLCTNAEPEECQKKERYTAAIFLAVSQGISDIFNPIFSTLNLILCCMQPEIPYVVDGFRSRQAKSSDFLPFCSEMMKRLGNMPFTQRFEDASRTQFLERFATAKGKPTPTESIIEAIKKASGNVNAPIGFFEKILSTKDNGKSFPERHHVDTVFNIIEANQLMCPFINIIENFLSFDVYFPNLDSFKATINKVDVTGRLLLPERSKIYVLKAICRGLITGVKPDLKSKPEFEFNYTKPLGDDPKLAEMLKLKFASAATASDAYSDYWQNRWWITLFLNLIFDMHNITNSKPTTLKSFARSFQIISAIILKIIIESPNNIYIDKMKDMIKQYISNGEARLVYKNQNGEEITVDVPKELDLKQQLNTTRIYDISGTVDPAPVWLITPMIIKGEKTHPVLVQLNQDLAQKIEADPLIKTRLEELKEEAGAEAEAIAEANATSTTEIAGDPAGVRASPLRGNVPSGGSKTVRNRKFRQIKLTRNSSYRKRITNKYRK